MTREHRHTVGFQRGQSTRSPARDRRTRNNENAESYNAPEHKRDYGKRGSNGIGNPGPSSTSADTSRQRGLARPNGSRSTDHRPPLTPGPAHPMGRFGRDAPPEPPNRTHPLDPFAPDNAPWQKPRRNLGRRHSEDSFRHSAGPPGLRPHPRLAPDEAHNGTPVWRSQNDPAAKELLKKLKALTLEVEHADERNKQMELQTEAMMAERSREKAELMALEREHREVLAKMELLESMYDVSDHDNYPGELEEEFENEKEYQES